MNQKHIVNGIFCQIGESSITPVFGDAIIQDDTIVQIQPKEFDPETLSKAIPFSDNEIYNAGGRVITAPLVNFHDHIYSRLAKGLPTLGDFSNFENILKFLWWKLDCFLDDEMNRASAQLTALESIRNGVTYIVDHHSSQMHIEGSLGILKKTLNSAMLSALLCFETTDRNGHDRALAGLKENIDFIKNHSNEFAQGLIGLHASFTLNEETLAEAAKLMKEYNTGIHIHLCEDKADRKRSVEKFGLSPVKRLKQHKLLNDRSILAHGLFVKKEEFKKLKKTGAALALNVDSNMNNGVGVPPYSFIPAEMPILIGTDGMHANLAKAFKQVFLAARLSGLSFGEAFGIMIKIYFDQVNFICKFFPQYPSLTAGSKAELIIWNYVPPTPLTKDNFWGHYIYGVVESPVATVMKNGEYIMKDFQLSGINEGEMRDNIYRQGARLMDRFIEEAKQVNK